ncbi:hypothetical protein GGS20DRAFT_432518 [Poronia punctata]|nr:hypothetical protein GGS20DRAFT_432518 [Poronia punctata]
MCVNQSVVACGKNFTIVLLQLQLLHEQAPPLEPAGQTGIWMKSRPVRHPIYFFHFPLAPLGYIKNGIGLLTRVEPEHISSGCVVPVISLVFSGGGSKSAILVVSCENDNMMKLRLARCGQPHHR